MSCIQITNLTFSYSGSLVPVFDGFNIRLDTSWKLALVGDNGRGKTTLLKLLCGEIKGEGRIDANMAFRRFPFKAEDESAAAEEVIYTALPDAQIWKIRREFNLIGLDSEILYRPYSTLSGGEKTKLQLAALFACEGFALIDEPTDHLDIEGRARLSEYLSGKEGFIVVSHDRAFLDGCCDHILALEKTGQRLIRGGYSVYAEERKKREKEEATSRETLESERARLKASAARTAEWADKAERGKYAKGSASGEKPVDRGFIGASAARVQKRAGTVIARQTQAEAELKELLKGFTETENLTLFPEKFFRSRIVTLSDITVKVPSKTLFENLNFTVDEGERIAVTGGNGAGKSTLLKLIRGEEIPYSGIRDISPRLKISYVPQTADYAGTLGEYAKDFSIDESYFKAILSKFNFNAKDFDRDMRLFSEGQKKKAALARSLCERANLYIWDEPLNYLDVRSREQIEEAILSSGATLLFVEHDASFVSTVATRRLEI